MRINILFTQENIITDYQDVTEYQFLVDKKKESYSHRVSLPATGLHLIGYKASIFATVKPVVLTIMSTGAPSCFILRAIER